MAGKTHSTLISVLHIITGLENNGAETMLFKLIKSSNPNNFKHSVISLGEIGPIGRRLIDDGYVVKACGFVSGRLPLKPFISLMMEIIASKPSIVQTWLYHADLIGGVTARVCGCKNVVWNIRQSNIDAEVNSKHSLIAMKLCSLLSSIVPKAIVSNSNKAILVHEAAGYDSEKFKLIPNGFEVNKPKRSINIRMELRLNWGLTSDSFVIGFFARYDPQKNHKGLIDAFYELSKSKSNAFLVLAGKGVDSENSMLKSLIDQYGIQDKIKLLGFRPDVQDLFYALDLFVLPSIGEGFPNSLGEAMNSGLPCISSDVGDCKYVLEDERFIVPPNSSSDLFAKMSHMIGMPKDELIQIGLKNQERIASRYGIRKIVEKYEKLYFDLYSR